MIIALEKMIASRNLIRIKFFKLYFFYQNIIIITMKYLISILLMFFMNFTFASELNLRDYDEFDIPEGTHIPVISLQEFSTAYCEEGDKVEFKSTLDIFMFNKKIIPEGTRLVGYIDKKNEPIIGTHAAMRVFVNKMYLKDGTEIPIKAYIYTSNNNLIGGGLTPPAEYIKMPHYQRWAMFRAMGTLQCVPGATRKMGEHVTISSGADLIVVLAEPVHMSHSVLY